jgi:hypothetical protein
MEAGRTTVAGLFQTLEHLGGLPLFVDEAHTAPDPKRLELAAYSFANGQRYTVGSAEGQARGGTDLAGALLLAGEAIPEFKHAGSRLRVLWVDSAVWAPLGAEPRSASGQRRAALLETAWETGSGLFGAAVADVIWRDWAAFIAAAQRLEQTPALTPLQAWRTPLALAAATLDVALTVANLAPPPPFAALLDQWAAILLSGHSETDPATDAWDALATMLIQGRWMDDALRGDDDVIAPAQWEWIDADHGGGLLACRRVGDPYWRVLPATPQFKERVGASAVQLYGPTWAQRGWITLGADGKPIAVMKTRDGRAARMLRIPTAALEAWGAPAA